MRREALFLALALVVAGCIHGAETEKPKQIEISTPQCTVSGNDCGSVEVTRFSSPQVKMTVSNFGDSRVVLDLNKEVPKGDMVGSRVLVSQCNLYNIQDFDAKKRSPSSLENLMERPDPPRSVTLDSGEELELVWNLDFNENVDVSTLGYTCPLDFAVSFRQYLNTTRQVQVKSSEDIPDVSVLHESTTSNWPVRLVIESEEHVVRPPGRETTTFVARSYLVNNGPGEVRSIEAPNADYGIDLGFEGARQSECTEKDLFMHGRGERSGQSARERCSFVPREVESSSVFDLVARTSYRYRIDLESTEISLVSLEGPQSSDGTSSDGDQEDSTENDGSDGGGTGSGGGGGGTTGDSTEPLSP